MTPAECRRHGSRRGPVARPAWRVFVLLGVGACGRAEPTPQPAAPPPAVAVRCEPGPLPAAFAPGVSASLERAEAFTGAADDAVLLEAAALAQLRLAAAAGADGIDPWRGGWGPEGAAIDARARVASYAGELARGEVVEQQRDAIAAARARVDALESVDHARLVVTQSQLYCAPIEGAVLRAPYDPAFDRNLCSTLHPGELVRVLGRSDAGAWLLVDAGHTLGWVRGATLSARLSEDDRVAWRDAPRLHALRDDVRTRAGVPLRLGVGLPLAGRDDDGSFRVRVAAATGPIDDHIAADAAVVEGYAVLTRAGVLAAAFAQIGAPYGWGGRDGGRDCSQWLRDTLVPFGITLPRHSSQQALAGVRTVDVAGLDDAAKLAAIDDAAATGLVLEYLPGHVMLDVGARDGHRFAISSIAEFLVPCDGGGGDTLYRLDRVAVTDLETGRGSARTSLLERITTLAVFGPA